MTPALEEWSVDESELVVRLVVGNWLGIGSRSVDEMAVKWLPRSGDVRGASRCVSSVFDCGVFVALFVDCWPNKKVRLTAYTFE